MSNWMKVCKIGDIPPLGARQLIISGVPIAVFRTSGDRIFAIEDRCPHKGGPLSQGIVHGNAVACPLHNWVIDLETGEAKAPDKGCVRRLPAKREGLMVLVDASAVIVQAAE